MGAPEKTPGKKNRARLLSSLCRAWFEMTSEEQRAIVIILAIFLLGTATRVWHICL